MFAGPEKADVPQSCILLIWCGLKRPSFITASTGVSGLLKEEPGGDRRANLGKRYWSAGTC